MLWCLTFVAVEVVGVCWSVGRKATQADCMASWQGAEVEAETTRRQWQPLRGGDLLEMDVEAAQRADKEEDPGAETKKNDVRCRILIEFPHSASWVEPSKNGIKTTH